MGSTLLFVDEISYLELELSLSLSHAILVSPLHRIVMNFFAQSSPNGCLIPPMRYSIKRTPHSSIDHIKIGDSKTVTHSSLNSKTTIRKFPIMANDRDTLLRRFNEGIDLVLRLRENALNKINEMSMLGMNHEEAKRQMDDLREYFEEQGPKGTRDSFHTFSVYYSSCRNNNISR